VARGAAPTDAREVGSVTSPPLSEIVQGMITASDNDTAEMLTREVGVARGGDGSTEVGTRTVEKELQSLGIPTNGFALHDGSGLAKSDRVTCRALLDAIERLRDARFAAIDQGLPVAGRTGTLIGRLADDPLTGVLRAKTGYVDDVAGLAGIVDDADHLRFAFIANDQFSATAGRNLADQVARIIATYPEVPDPGTIVPAP
jgi:D-alanyl-D-alanine carboxypeptidase/D-alanyl-D-alanine-endopeptidase (penicillin-binding protein 4)